MCNCIETRSDTRLSDEFDSLDDLLRYLGNKNSKLIAMQISEMNYEKIIDGISNDNYIITYKDTKAVLRIPGIGTTWFVNRNREARVQKLISGLPFILNTIMFCGGSFKISDYLPDARYVDCGNNQDFTELLNIVNQLHSINVMGVEGIDRDLAGELLLYENSFDYSVISADVVERYFCMKKVITKIIDHSIYDQTVLTHGDILPQNVLISKEGKMYLIDFEYSGLLSPYWDYASLILENEVSLENPTLCAFIQDMGMLKKYLVLVDFIYTAWAISKVSLGDRSLSDYLEKRLSRCERLFSQYAFEN